MPKCKTLVVALCGILAAGTVTADNTDRLMRKAARYFAPLPATMPGAENDTAERIALGEKLFSDTRLSINDVQSCASCHHLTDGAAGVDNLARRTRRVRRSQHTHGTQCRLAEITVLGRARQRSRRSGRTTDTEPGRDGHAERTGSHR